MLSIDYEIVAPHLKKIYSTNNTSEIEANGIQLDVS
jgi:hypothetical protein